MGTYKKHGINDRLSNFLSYMYYASKNNTQLYLSYRLELDPTFKPWPKTRKYFPTNIPRDVQLCYQNNLRHTIFVRNLGKICYFSANQVH